MKINYLFSISSLILFTLLSGCSDQKETVLFKKLSSHKTNINFINKITESDSVNVVSFTNIYNGGGIGVADFNKDGLPDLFFTGNMVSSKLYLNNTVNGDIKFKDVSKEANIFTGRWATGVSIADVNDDGWPDIYVCVSGSDIPEKRQNYLFIHQGLNENKIPVFREMAGEYGLDDKTYSTQAAFFDYDLDGDLDLFISVNFADQFYGATVNIPSPSKKGYTDRSDRLYQNIGTGKDGHPVFKDVSIDAGILHEGYTLGLVIQDINKDGWPDIYESNDFLSNDIFYENQGDGTFINKMGEYFKHTTFAGMGMDISDFNNDGWSDIFVLDMTPADNVRQKSMMLPVKRERFMLNLQTGYYPQYNRNTLQLNNGFDPYGDLSFSEIGQMANVHHTDWSWTALFADLDNSGYRDLMICNGFRRDLQDIDNIHYLFGDNPFGTREHWERQFADKVKDIPGIHVNNYLLKNNGDLTFTDKSAEWGFNHPSYSNGGITADLDRDGDLDIVINNLDESPFVYENRTISKDKKGKDNFNYLKVQFAGKTLNASNIGTKISLHHGEQIQHHQHFVVRGYLSSMDPVVHFGLGRDTLIDKLEVQWPDGECRIIKNVDANQLLHLEREEKNCDIIEEKNRDLSLFENITAELDIGYQHREFNYNDFIFQPLLLHMHSLNGPGMAVGDINGDQLDDLVVGGARGQPAYFFLQDEEGKFRERILVGSEPYEDQGLVLFDADKDGDLDLYAVSGSSEHGLNTAFYQDRIYVNDGRGKFTRDSLALPVISSSGSCVLAEDMDNDGDLDLFIGGRIQPREFPTAPDSYLLRNDSGKEGIRFVDVTDSRAPEIRNIGMVSAGLFTDFNNDGLVDLILVGEWMPVSLFKNTGSSFVLIEAETGLNNSDGWWNSINGADFDKDGDMDYIVGNLGLNSWLKAGKEEPLNLYADDFDRDGKIDPLVFHYVEGKNVPFHPGRLLKKQLSYLENEFPTYSDFATADLNDILDENKQKQARKLNSYELRSCYMENLGNNKFKMRSLPMITQTAPVFGILIDDFDDDGYFDAILAGNTKASNLTLGWYDASIGYLLKGRGDGTFSVIDGTEYGFFVDTDARSMIQVKSVTEDPLVVVSNNDDSLLIFKRKIKPAGTVPYIEGVTHGYIVYKDNSRQKFEYYKGSGYFSAQGNTLYIGSQVGKVEFYNSDNELILTNHFD